jgi:hypothetical protein
MLRAELLELLARFADCSSRLRAVLREQDRLVVEGTINSTTVPSVFLSFLLVLPLIVSY